MKLIILAVAFISTTLSAQASNCSIGVDGENNTLIVNGSEMKSSENLVVIIKSFAKMKRAGLCYGEASDCSIGSICGYNTLLVDGVEIKLSPREDVLVQSLEMMKEAGICK
jgi:hypothetical protein